MTFEEALAEARNTGLSRCSDAAAMAALLESADQLLLGAVSPKLIWQGAQSRGMTNLELANLVSHDPEKARNLMWEVD